MPKGGCIHFSICVLSAVSSDLLIRDLGTHLCKASSQKVNYHDYIAPRCERVCEMAELWMDLQPNASYAYMFHLRMHVCGQYIIQVCVSLIYRNKDDVLMFFV